MNRLYSFVVFIFLFLFSHSVFAETCSVAGNKDYVVQFQVVGSNYYQDIAFTHGKDKYVLWYTQQEEPLEENVYHFNEQGLSLGQTYTVRIEVEHTTGNSNIANYYLIVNGMKVHQDTQNNVAANGKLEGTGTNISNLECGESVDLPELEQCAAFPRVVQSWSSSSSSSSSLNILGGGSRIFDAHDEKSGHVGFGTVVDQSHEGYDQPACDGDINGGGVRCIAEPSLLISEPAIIPFSSRDELTFDKEVRDIPEGKYTNVSLNGWGEYRLTGTYYEFDSLTLPGSVKLVVKDNTLIRLKTFTINGSSTLGSSDHSDGIPENITIWGEDNSNINIDTSTPFYANIFSRQSVNLGGGSIIIGSITAFEINMSGNRIQRVEDNCEVPTVPTGKTFIIQPKTAQALTCERIPVDFYVVDDNGQPITGYSNNFNANAIDLPNGSACWSEQSSGGTCTSTALNSQFINGAKRLYLQSTTVGNLNVTATVASDNLSATEGPYRFVPFGFQFEPKPAKVIAGKPFTVQVKALADTGGACETIDNYNGTKDLTLSSTNYQQPSSGSKLVTATDTNLVFTQGIANLELTYRDAGHVSVTVSDPDWTKEQCGADCEDYQGSWTGLSGNVDIYSRPYTFALCNIQANSGNGPVINPQGTATSGNGFTAAGDEFSLYSKPIIWANGDSELGIVDLSSKDFCNYETTPNYSQSDALAAKQILSIPTDKPHSPVGGKVGILSGGVEKLHTDIVNGIYTFSGLSWNEVGSILLTSNLDGPYYDMTVNPSTIPVGRFYPAKLALIEDHIVYPLGQEENGNYVGFGYMNQPVGHDFIVEAQNRQSEPTYNYGLFADNLMVDIDYLAIDGNDVDFTSRLDSATWVDLSWKGSDWGKADIYGVASNARLAPHTQDFMMSKLPDPQPSTTNYTTIPDGPYDGSNSQFGLWVSNKVDGVDFQILDLNGEGIRLSEQPDFRYGRMHLKDVAGNSGQEIRVPLRTEYWKSSEFIINKDDRRSEYSAPQHFCSKVIWTNGSNSSASLNGFDTVTEGKSNKLSATHVKESDSHREQVRLWLRQGMLSPQRSETNIDCSKATSYTNQPWLQYNWRDKGDEDPSAVVTFGVFRGNDRIIFKGERALIGNEN
ncbi:MSHA biogenesis protein MshQ [Vibrio halioticoli NBRC 102217]|uniref:MSHA biogenesis protein MshQ n=1 Tax=Vibrio halioticoli NBRC 102217 TaxID=1219072 RepID=V5FAI5_9VIBR|nr:DUF6701 domain-containing protein [Vibrio halioticoli]GAD88158.1 MSHA biogenesis protein MshQ [Vibrio halioticoli NBRC 102217]